MGEGCDLVETEHRTRPFDRVKGTKSRIDEFAVVGAERQIQQSPFENFEELACFLSEDISRIQ